MIKTKEELIKRYKKLHRIHIKMRNAIATREIFTFTSDEVVYLNQLQIDFENCGNDIRKQYPDVTLFDIWSISTLRKLDLSIINQWRNP